MRLASAVGKLGSCGAAGTIQVAQLMGVQDKFYALGLTGSLVSNGFAVDFIRSDLVDTPHLHDDPVINFLNLRGDQRKDAGTFTKTRRLARFCVRLLRYAAQSQPRPIHIVWNNKFKYSDRTLLMACYRLLGWGLILTAHNANGGKRDGRDSALNRLSLGVQYRLSRHIFVGTDKMKREFETDFGVAPDKASVVPFGITDLLPRTNLTGAEAGARLRLPVRRPSGAVLRADWPLQRPCVPGRSAASHTRWITTLSPGDRG
ncbi:MAG: glycosyltransferase family 4 protein [Pseudomonadota bacterium]|nr:glycosyltransferase family 4 protein [Pseudomonadota bacterium]